MDLLTPEQLEVATPAELELYQHQLEFEIATQSPLDLACWLSPETERTPHLEYINERIVALVELRLYPSGPGPKAEWYYVPHNGKRKKLVSSVNQIPDNARRYWGEHPETGEHVVFELGIAVPPRHGKSWVVTDHLPIWFWTRFPDAKIAFATYSDKFAEHWGRRIKRRILENHKKLGYSFLQGERQSVSELAFSNMKGEMYLVGTGGSLTGKGWNLGIIDDPIKDGAQAISKTERDNIADWYESTFDTRATKLGFPSLPVQIMMFTRWHEDDLAGRYIYKDRRTINDDWHMIRLPALAEEGDPLGRDVGEALWPAVMTADELETRKDRNAMWFSALFQGNPTMGDKGMFPRWYFYDSVSGVYSWEDQYGQHRIAADDCIRFATLDTAYTKNTWSDYSVFAVWDYDRATQRLFLVSVMRDRVESPELLTWLETNYRSSGVSFVGIEDVTSGKQLIQEIQRKSNIVFRRLTPDKDKVGRALPYGMAAANGLVLLPKRMHLLQEWLDEHASFDGQTGAHDDMVDAGAYAHFVSTQMPKVEAQGRHIVDMTMEGKFQRLNERLDKQVERKNRQRGRLSGMLGR